MADTLYLVDGSSILFRAFFAIRHLSTRDGRPTNAVFGVLKMAQKLLRDHDPTHMAFVFDRPEPTFRHEQFEAYKANRPEAPPDMVVQIEPAKEAVRALGLPVLELAGYEADDIIGTLAGAARSKGMDVIIVTADKDMFQLVVDGVQILHTKKEDALLDAHGVEEVFGVPPERVVDVLALWGDPTDNIPGVPGVGEKGAKELVRQFGDLESVLAHAQEVKRKSYREGLLQNAEQARQSRELATIMCDVPLDYGPDDLERTKPDTQRLQDLYREMEFFSLLEELPGSPAETVEAGARPLDEAGHGALAKSPWAGLYRNDGLLYFSDGDAAWSLPVKDLEPALFSGLKLCAHGAKSVLRRLGPERFRPGKDFVDAAVAAFMLDPAGKVRPISELADLYLGQRARPGDGAAASVLLARLAPRLLKELDEAGMASLYQDVERPLVGVLARMEAAGIGLDLPYFEELNHEITSGLERLEKGIFQAAGENFNVASPKQVGEILFEKLGLPVKKRTSKTKSYSTDNEVLESLKDAHPVVPLILEHRILSKLKGTYVDALPGCVNQETGRVHATFHQMVTATGRLSSSDPNLQNIPARGDWGPRIRRGFVAAKGCVFVGADYSQIELRMLAHLSGADGLKKVFREKEDIHTRTASEIFGAAPGLVTADMRRAAKAVNFGIIYGMGPFGLARELGVPQKEAKEFIERYFSRFPAVRDYIDGVRTSVLNTEEVTTILGRRRFFPGIGRAPKPQQQALLRQAVNTTVQGSAADLIKKAMVRVEPLLPEGARLVLQVHDELILEAPEDQAEKAGEVLGKAMETAMELSVPLVAEVAAGRRWSDLK